MKRLHRPDLFCWSVFDESRDLDFHSLLWVRAGGNVAIDPLPLSPHDRKHLDEVGGVGLVLVTNADHMRNAEWLARTYDARLAGPRAERDDFPLRCDLWLDDGDTPVPGLRVLALDGSKTPGELAFVLDGTTLVTGDLVRAHEGGRLTTLPAAKLRDAAAAARSVRRLAALPGIDAVLVGDGWPIFRGGGDALRELAAGLGSFLGWPQAIWNASSPRSRRAARDTWSLAALPSSFTDTPALPQTSISYLRWIPRTSVARSMRSPGSATGRAPQCRWTSSSTLGRASGGLKRRASPSSRCGVTNSPPPK